MELAQEQETLNNYQELMTTFIASYEDAKKNTEFSSFLGKIKTKPTIKECDCCLSGVQNICEKMYKNGISREEISAYVLKHIEDTLYKMTINIFDKYGKMPVLFSGGVMSNSIIRNNLTAKLGAYFAQPEFSTDNAAGIAVLTAIKNKEDLL